MMYAYPDDLARLVHERLKTQVFETPPDDLYHLLLGPRGLAFLERLLSTCYQASLLHEEGRSLAFRVALTEPHFLPVHAGPPDGLHRVRFAEPRSLDVDELRHLAPAVKFQRSLLGARWNQDNAPEIWGVIQSGPGWLRGVQGGRGHYNPGPMILTMSVTGPGRMAVSFGPTTLARLVGGHLSDSLLDVFESQWLPALFENARRELFDLHSHQQRQAAVALAQVDIQLPRMIGQHFIRRILATIRLARHGGTLLFLPPASADDIIQNKDYLHLKYHFENEEPRQRFRTLLLRVLSAFADSHPAPACLGWPEYNATTNAQVGALDEAIFELAHWVAALADVDGAVLLTQHFEVVGFAGEIRGDLPDVPTVRRALDLEGQQCITERTDSVGTRHRSAYRFCRALPAALAIVISQDGGIRFVRSVNEVVTYWEQFSIRSLDL